jgi:hypothetical protein
LGENEKAVKVKVKGKDKRISFTLSLTLSLFNLQRDCFGPPLGGPRNDPDLASF